MTIKSRLLKTSSLFIGISLLMFYFSAGSVFAQLPITENDIYHINRNEYYRDPNANPTNVCGLPNSAGGNKVFYIGDSLTRGMAILGELLPKTQNAGYSVNLNYEELNAPGFSDPVRVKGESIEAIGGYSIFNLMPRLQEHPEDFSSGNADIIVIGLGTNIEPNFTNKIVEMIDYIRSVNQTAQIYWVNTYFRPSQDTYKTVNAEIEAAAQQREFTIIDFATAAATDNGLALASDQVHHGAVQYGNKVDFILSQLPKGTPQPQQTVSDDTLKDDLNTITLNEDEKIAQTFIVGFNGSQSEEMAQIVEEFKIGGVYILGDDNEVYTKAFFNGLSTRAGIPLIVASDEEGGRIQRFAEQIGEYPSAKELGTRSNEEVEQTAKELGEKLLDRGVNTNLAPVADLSIEGSGAIFDLDRGFSSDPAVVAEKASAFAKGLSLAGVTPVYKHFPGLGTTPGNTDNEAQTSPNIQTLIGRDLLAFEPIVNQHGAFVMLSNAIVPGLTDQQVGEEDDVAGTSAAAVDLLRTEYNFSGIITSDDLGAGALRDRNIADVVSNSLQAGVTMPLFGYKDEAQIRSIINKVKSDEVNVDNNLLQILQHKNQIRAENGCAPTLTGDNEADVFRILVTTYGFTSEQAAGVIGNMRHESGVEPMRLQGTPPGEETPSSTVDIAATSGIGWGLVQWTPTGKIIEQSFIRGTPYSRIDTIDFQLEFLVGQLRGEGIGGEVSSEKTRAGDPFFASTTVEDAASIFAIDYERCADCKTGNPEVQDRINDAIDVLTRFGSY